MDYWGGAKGMLPPPLKLLGGPGPPPLPSECRGSSYYLSDTVLPEQAGLVNWDRRI